MKVLSHNKEFVEVLWTDDNETEFIPLDEFIKKYGIDKLPKKKGSTVESVELMGGQPNSSKPSGYFLLEVNNKGKEIIVSDDGGKTKERYSKSNGFSGYTLHYKGNQYEFTDSYAKGSTIDGGVDASAIRQKIAEMNVALNTKNGQVYVGGIKPKNRLFKDEKGYYLVEEYGKFMGKKYPIKKHFTPSENEVLDVYMQDKYAKGGNTPNNWSYSIGGL